MNSRSVNWKQVRALHAVLAAAHPGVFDLDFPVPFKIDIRRDIQQLYPEMPRRPLVALMCWLTGRSRYLESCTAGHARFDLDCRPHGLVTRGEAERISIRLQQHQKARRVTVAHEGATACP